MEFIDKAKGQQDADSILNDFMALHQHKDAQGTPQNGQYVNVVYEELSANNMTFSGKNASHRDHLIDVMRMTQQDSHGAQHCCYCMRRINDEKVTLEHIIQQSLNENDRAQYNDYINYGLPFLTAGNVILACDYTARFNVAGQNVPPYPHVIAYYNLVASCFGYFPKEDNREQQLTVCCNNKRSNAHVYPLFYDQDWKNKVKYAKNGWMVVLYNGVNAQIKQGLVNLTSKVGLNAVPLLEIRRLWYLLRKEDIFVLRSINTKSGRGAKLYWALRSADATEEDKPLRKKYSTDDYWVLLMKYDWFWEYYRSEYP